MKVLVAALVATLMVFVSIAGSVGLSLWAINSSEHKWCTTLNLLTAHPVPKPSDPTANPSRENAYIFYTNLKTLEKEFHC